MTTALQLRCCRAGCLFPAALLRQSTAYVSESENWITACLACYEEAEEYWRERWEDYYAGISPYQRQYL